MEIRTKRKKKSKKSPRSNKIFFLYKQHSAPDLYDILMYEKQLLDISYVMWVHICADCSGLHSTLKNQNFSQNFKSESFSTTSLVCKKLHICPDTIRLKNPIVHSEKLFRRRQYISNKITLLKTYSYKSSVGWNNKLNGKIN